MCHLINLSLIDQSTNPSLETVAKKRKLGNDTNTKTTLGHQNEVPSLVTTPSKSPVDLSWKTSSVQENNEFKMPASSHDQNSLSKIKLRTFIPRINIPAFPHQPKQVKLQMKKEILSSADEHNSIDNLDIHTNNTDKSMPPHTEHSPEMFALCNAMIEQNTHKVAECIRTSLESTFSSFMDAINPTQQIHMLHEMLGKQRIESDAMVMNLQTQNVDLTDQLEQLKGKHEILICKNDQVLKQNREFIDNLTTLKAENEKLIGELQGELAKNGNLTGNLNAMSTKNAKLTATVDKLRTINDKQANSLKNAEANNSYLNGANKALMDSTETLKMQLENLKLDYNIQRDQLMEEKTKADIMKTKAFEECAKMITDTKKKQWCAACGMPGGRFYCNSQCEEYYW